MPFPDDYKGSVTEKTATSLQGSNFKPDGDHRKASKIIYEMAVGEGVGEGKENERVIFLGRDMTASMDNVFEGLKHTMETFRDVSNNVYRDE